MSTTATPATAEQSRHEVLFIEGNVADLQTLINSANPDTEIHVLDATQDGLAQIAAILAGRSGIDALHLISHGSSGSLQLGTLSLNTQNLSDHAAALASIGRALSADADILLYGCEVGKGTTGAAFIDALAQATQADIAASDDLTGNAAKGGNWILETISGVIDSREFLADAFKGTLADVTIGTPSNHTATSNTNGHDDVGQTFTATKTGVLSSIRVASNNNDDGSDWTLKIYEGAGIGGTLLHTQTGASIGNTVTDSSNYTLATINLNAAVNITNGQTYTFAFTPDTAIDFMYTDDAYAGGVLFSNSAGGGILPGLDLIFEVVQGDASATVSSVSVPSNATYTTGDNLDFTVHFSENITVDTGSGTPYIPITLDTGGTVNASYLSGSGSSALVFRYIVASGNLDSDGVAVGSAIAANGGTLQDSFGNNATLTLNSVGSTTAVLVDAAAPTVTSVSVPANASYKVGDNLDFTVNFGENVTVNTVGGTPYIPITLDTGGTVNATYLSGSNSSALVFRYTVASGNLDSNGIAVGAAITANGGTLLDAVGNTATLTLNSVGSTAAVLVDGVAPAVSSVSVPTNGTYKIGDSLNFTVNFGENVTVNTGGGTPYLPITLDTGGTVQASYVSGSSTSALVFSYTVTSGTLDSNGIAVGAAITNNGGTLRDAAGNDATLTLNSVGSTAAVLVDGTAPTVTSVTSSTGDGNYKAGDTLSIQISFSENVSVTGTPQLTLETGTTDRVINYSSGSGSSTLSFTYTVQAGDTSADLDYLSTAALALNGGTIKDGAGNNATLTLPSPGASGSLGANRAIVIDTTAPTTTIATASFS
ncbi:DUF4347 domain-containing protein, partial [Azovibrio restrictus]|uniref:DUF4347 domain-containing protein n=1 Tax=Azovibrio restrictus TaxID=146938 RepID=UPI0026ECB410